MYNLLIAYSDTPELWENPPYHLHDKTRFLELGYTDYNIYLEYKNVDDPAVMQKICSLPALFMYEKKNLLPGHTGQITKFTVGNDGVKIWFTIDSSRRISWGDLERYEMALGLQGRWEAERTHWAIKDVDLEKVLSKAAPRPIKAFVSYKWESEEHRAWVRTLAEALRKRGIDAVLDQWEVRFGGSFTDYMQAQIAKADVILFIITSESVKAAEAPDGKGGSLKFEVQMMNALRIAGEARIIGIYRSGDRPPLYLRDHRYADFRNDQNFEASLDELVKDLLGQSGPPPLLSRTGTNAPIQPAQILAPHTSIAMAKTALGEFLLQPGQAHQITLYGGTQGNGRVFVQNAYLIKVEADMFTVTVQHEHGIVHAELPLTCIENYWKQTDGVLAIKIQGRLEFIIEPAGRLKLMYLP